MTSKPLLNEAPLTAGEYWLRLRVAEATMLCRECEELIEDNANVEAQIASNTRPHEDG